MKTSGQCLCGAIRFELSGPPSILCYCHCELCRRSVGAAPVAWASYDRAGFRLLAGAPAWFSSSPTARRGFCATCGSSLFFESANAPNDIDVTIATLESANELAPDRHIWVSSKLAWERTDDGFPCHARDTKSPLV
jgi:hypothetical protein